MDCDRPPWAQVPEWGIPRPKYDTDCNLLAGTYYSKTFATSGPIQWRDVFELVDEDNGGAIQYWAPGSNYPADLTCIVYPGAGSLTPASTPVPDDFPTGVLISPSSFSFFRDEDWSAWCLDPVYGIYGVPSDWSAQTNCKQNVFASCGTTVAERKRSFSRPAFPALPSTKTTDETFTLNIKARNPFTNNYVDGTHGHADAQEKDLDTIPNRSLYVISGENSGDNIQVNSNVRNGFGDYTLTFQPRIKVGTRKFKLFYFTERLTNRRVTVYSADTTEIIVTHGTAKVVGIEKVFSHYSLGSYKYMVNQPIKIDGSDVTCPILDTCGESDLKKKFNIVLTSSASVDLEFEDGGGNAVSSPSLAGTYPRNASSGVATFDDLKAFALGRDYIIRATSSGLSGSLNTDWFYEFYPQFYIGLKFQSVGSVTSGVPVSISVDLVDYDDVVVSPATVDNLTLSSSPSAGVTGLGAATPSAGTATWPSVTFPSPGTYTLSVTTSGVTYDGPPTTTQLVVVVT
jgi:hypothetical protein